MFETPLTGKGSEEHEEVIPIKENLHQQGLLASPPLPLPLLPISFLKFERLLE